MVIPPVIHSSSLSGPEIWISASGSWSTSKAFTKTKPADTDGTSWNGTSTEKKNVCFSCFFLVFFLGSDSGWFSTFCVNSEHMAETSGKIQCFIYSIQYSMEARKMGWTSRPIRWHFPLPSNGEASSPTRATRGRTRNESALLRFMGRKKIVWSAKIKGVRSSLKNHATQCCMDCGLQVGLVDLENISGFGTAYRRFQNKVSLCHGLKLLDRHKIGRDVATKLL